MEGVWQTGPKARTKLRILNPLHWSERMIRVFITGFFMIALPIYLYIGFRPASSLDYTNYPKLNIPSIALAAPVAEIHLKNRELIAPDTIAGIYHAHPNKLFIIGHSSTVFKNLDQVRVADYLSYGGEAYQIITKTVLEKSAINMADILADADERTIVLMTCAGKSLPNHDATHRLIITAKLSK